MIKVSESTRTLIAVFVVIALALAFWLLFIAPKRKEAGALETQVTELQSSLAQTQSAITAGETARRDFPREYQQLVVLGKAVPAGDESASLLVQVNHISDKAGVKFESLKVGTGSGSEAAAAPVEEAAPAPEEPPAEGSTEASGSEAATVPTATTVPTEAAASQLPIGAAVGPAGLSVLPYDLSFKGGFFDVADFIKGIDSMIHTSGADVAVSGRLVTLDGFSLSPSAEESSAGDLNASFSVTTYLVPPSQGITAGASPSEPSELASSPSISASNLR